MKRDDALVQNVARLADLEVQYDTTIRVLAVLVERVQQLTGSAEIQISVAAIIDQPDLNAWRDASDSIISLTATR